MLFPAESFVHNLDPFLLQFSGQVGIRWYGLAYAAGFLVGWLILHMITSRGRTPLEAQSTGDFLFSIVIGVLLGGRLGYAVFYDPSLFYSFSGEFPFWKMLAINQGGMASHGGMIGVTIAVFLFFRRKQIPVLHGCDICALLAAPGLGFGRAANFINGELPGKPLPGAMQADPPWWSVKYPRDILDPGFDAGGNMADLAQAIPEYADRGQGFRSAVVEVIYAGDTVVAESLAPFLTACYPSQIIQAIVEGPVLLVIMLLAWLRPRRPGIPAATFLLSYGCLRIATEAWRLPDEGVSMLAGMSRGQGLSVLLIGAAIGMFIVAWKRPEPRMGGFMDSPIGP